ncbi:hypothetical protein Y1Q_0019498 [Alligator mississippiensis]|uniref:Uncharacterized protein n=1 Tax=Alligator mississippiensis TaxID=8496 RepID=A0A151NMI5_ALLMI|nr:hypothetical protein Y1Q_0019498 [Alligator mississippiensis]
MAGNYSRKTGAHTRDIFSLENENAMNKQLVPTLAVMLKEVSHGEYEMKIISSGNLITTIEEIRIEIQQVML